MYIWIIGNEVEIIGNYSPSCHPFGKLRASFDEERGREGVSSSEIFAVQRLFKHQPRRFLAALVTLSRKFW